MRLLEVKYVKNKYLVLCKQSIVQINLSNKDSVLIIPGDDVFGYTTRFIGLAEDEKDAKEKYPEEFL